MSYAGKNVCNRYGKTYPVRRIKRQPMATECEDQCSYSLIKVTVCDSEDDTDAVFTHDGDGYIKQEELEERTTKLNEEQIVDERQSTNRIEIGPTVIQPQYIGSSLHTTDASKAELIQCGGADVALGTTTSGAALYCGISDQTKEAKGILKENNFEKKRFTCNICEFKSDSRTDLAKHMCTHTREKRFSCNYCKYKYVRKDSLVIHMRNHTGERPFSCKLCEYKCVSKSYLAKHNKLNHTMEKLLYCNICEYICLTKSVLVIHMRTHTGEKPFSCNICGYKCAAKSYLTKHITRIHTNQISRASTGV